MNPAEVQRGGYIDKRWFRVGKLKLVVAKVHPLNNVADAHRYLEANQHLGKVVLTV